MLIQTNWEEHGIVCNHSVATSLFLVGDRKLDRMVYLTLEDTQGRACGLPHVENYVDDLIFYRLCG